MHHRDDERSRGSRRGWEQQDYGSMQDRERDSVRTGVDRGWDQPRGQEDDRDRIYGASPGGFARSQGYGGFQRGYEESLRAVPNYAGRGPKNWKRSDARIQEDVSELLERHPGIDASDVEVEVADGVVLLRGTVPQREMKRMAEDVIESCAGVRDVENHVRVARDIGFSTNAGGLVVHDAERATRDARPAQPSTRAAQAGTAAEARQVSAPRAGTVAGTPAEARAKRRR